MRRPLHLSIGLAAAWGMLAAAASAGLDAPRFQLGEPEDSWAEERADGGLELSIKVSPQTINLDSTAEGDWLTVHTDIPYSRVDTGTLALNGIPAVLAFPDDRGCLVAKFLLADIRGIVAPPDAALTLTGLRGDGTPFAGTEVVKVIDPLP